MSAERPGQQRWRRGGDVGLVPPGLFPQPSFDVEESVGDVKPGVEQADVVTAGCLEMSRRIQICCIQSQRRLHARKKHSSQTLQKLLFHTETL